MVELLVVIAILGVLAMLLVPTLSSSRRRAQRTLCLNNVRQYVVADTLYADDYGLLPEPNATVPTSIRVERLQQVAKYCNVPLPSGAPIQWPKRVAQPRWINCPMAAASGLAEGPTLGGGVYTGYAYYGGIEESAAVAARLMTVVRSGHAANRRNTYRGVLWADVLDAFAIADPRRYEFFHRTSGRKYSDFRFPAGELDGMHRGWSDGSVEWLSGSTLDLVSPNSPDLRLKSALGNFYF